MNLFTKILMGLVFLPFTLSAKINLPDIIGSNMVLQRQSTVKLWGKSSPNAPIHIQPSWSKQTYHGKADQSGNWLIKINTPEASYKSYSIRFSDGEDLVIDNILIGDVWFCSGQSNMEMPLRGFTHNPIEGAYDVIATSLQNKAIRMATIEHNGRRQPVDTCPGKWKVSSPENTPGFSATAYYFAMQTQKILDIPIGIIACSWGGSTVEGWLPEEIVKTYPDINLEKDIRNEGNNESWHYLSPVIMYNGMLHPLLNCTIKGFLWYQGESNVGRPDYAQRLKTMVSLWRKQFDQGELPFYFVQIAPYDQQGNIASAYLREQQMLAQQLIPNSGMVATADLVTADEYWNIHPRNKKDIGKRLAYLALKQTYGLHGFKAQGPIYKSMEIKGKDIIVTFDNVEDGFWHARNIAGFEIAGNDKKFKPAKAEAISRNQIKVTSDDVTQPVAVRYLFKDFQLGNVADLYHLPAFPFRTDNW